MPIYYSTNRDIKILNFCENDISAIYLSSTNYNQDSFIYELNVNQRPQQGTIAPILVKNPMGEVLPTNPVKTKLFYNKLFDIRGKSVISQDNNNFSVIVKAEYILLNGESKKIEVLKDDTTQTYALKTLWNNTCYEIHHLQAEKYTDIENIILTPKEIFYNGRPEVLSLNIFCKDFDYPMDIQKCDNNSFYNGSMGEDLFVLHTKDTQQFLAKYFKGSPKIASFNADKNILEKLGFNSPDAILDIKTETQSTSIYFSRPKGSTNYYIMFDKIPVIFETTLGKLPKQNDRNNYLYSFGDYKNLKSVIFRCECVQHTFNIEDNNNQTQFKYNTRKIPSQVFFDIFDKFYFVDVLKYTNIEEKFELQDMKLAFKITMIDKNDKSTFANFYTIDEQRALMYVGKDDGYIINNSFVVEILKAIEDLKK